MVDTPRKEKVSRNGVSTIFYHNSTWFFALRKNEKKTMETDQCGDLHMC